MFKVVFTLIALVGASVHLAFSPERRSSGAAIAVNIPAVSALLLCWPDGSAHRVCTRLPSR